MGLIKQESFERITRTLSSIGLPIAASNLTRSDIDLLIETIRLDKKVKYGLLTFILIQKIGKVRIENGISEASLRGILAQTLSN